MENGCSLRKFLGKKRRPAQRVQLVEDGVLRRFLTSRNGILGQSGSNGHGRSGRGKEVMARMGNLIVSARDPHSPDQLIEQWMAEGSKSITERALNHAKILLGEYEEPKLDEAKNEELLDYIARREAVIPEEGLNEEF